MTGDNLQAAKLQASAAITRAVAALEAGLSCNTPSQSDAGVTHAKEALQAIEVQKLMILCRAILLELDVDSYLGQHVCQ